MIKYIAHRIIENVSKRIERKMSNQIIEACDEMKLISHVSKKRLNEELAGFAGIIENSNKQIEHLLHSQFTLINNTLGKKILELEEEISKCKP